MEDLETRPILEDWRPESIGPDRLPVADDAADERRYEFRSYRDDPE